MFTIFSYIKNVIIFFIFFLIFTFLMGWFVFRLFQMSTDLRWNSQVREISFFLFLFLASLLLASLSDAVFKSTPIQWILWILLGSFFGMSVSKEGMLFFRNSLQNQKEWFFIGIASLKLVSNLLVCYRFCLF